MLIHVPKVLFPYLALSWRKKKKEEKKMGYDFCCCCCNWTGFYYFLIVLWPNSKIILLFFFQKDPIAFIADNFNHLIHLSWLNIAGFVPQCQGLTLTVTNLYATLVHTQRIYMEISRSTCMYIWEKNHLLVHYVTTEL